MLYDVKSHGFYKGCVWVSSLCIVLYQLNNDPLMNPLWSWRLREAGRYIRYCEYLSLRVNRTLRFVFIFLHTRIHISCEGRYVIFQMWNFYLFYFF